ncbi:MAG: carbohydrate porin [Alphaproteobacteria bacterium]|nr:carbohydrate porin [Alphaproteobacteria bacterium]
MKHFLLYGIGLGLLLWGANTSADTHISTHKNGSLRREHSFYRDLLSVENSMERDYADFKKWLNQKTGLTYSLDISFLGQRAAPNGKGTPWQTQYYGTANWDMFQSDTIGNGSMQIAYTAIRYWGKSAQNINNRIGVISSFNDYTTNANYFDQLSYTHQLPGKLNGLSVTIGQFPMYNFDGGNYDANQQINFLNYALSQNASETYPSASLGSYLTWTPTNQWSFSIGFQDAHNISGETISIHKFGKGRFTSFGSMTYSPTIEGLGQGNYSLLVYNQPGVAAQPGSSTGWSLNLQQNIGKKTAVFSRINGAVSSPVSIKQSYALGLVYNNPLNRNALDQIGFAGAVNKLNRSVNGPGTRAVENVLEAYWAWGISNFMTLTPDIQFYINPGANPNHKTATVGSLRATLMF